MPAAVHNLNRAKHGGQISRLVLGQLPRSMGRHVRQACKYRREIESLVVEAKGCVDCRDAHIIDVMCQAELHAGVCRWIMRTRLAKLSPADIAKCSEQILKAKIARNKAYDQLGLDRQSSSIIDALYERTDPDDELLLPDVAQDAIADQSATDRTSAVPNAAGGECRIPTDTPEQ